MVFTEANMLYHGLGQELQDCIHIPGESWQPLSDCLCWTFWFSHPEERRGPDEGFYGSLDPDKRHNKVTKWKEQQQKTKN